MKKIFKKVTLISLFCGVFVGADEIPLQIQKAIKFINSADYYYDAVSYFDGKQIIVGYDNKINSKPEKEKIEAIKASINGNKTYQAELAKFKTKDNDFCGEFFEDFKEFKNIEIKKPIVENVPYHDDTLRDTLGYCYYMGLDWVIQNYRYDGTREDDRWDGMRKPHSYTLYKTNFVGENNLFLVQNYYDPIFNENKDPKVNFKAVSVVNDNLCKSVFKSLKYGSDFNVFKDRKVLGEVEFGLGANNEDLGTGHYAKLISYKGKDIVMTILELDDFLRIILYQSFTDNRFEDDIKDIKCERKYYKSKNDKE